METSVRWKEQVAVYTPVEREIMSTLPVKEQALVHVLKSLAGGEIGEHSSEGNGLSVARHGDQSGVSPSTTATSPETRDLQANVGVIPDRQEPLNVYTDPED